MRFAFVSAAVAVLFAIAGRDEQSMADENHRLSVMQNSDAVTISDPKGKTILRYQLKGGAEKKLSVPSACYFHPFTTPAGVVVTEVAPVDHPHHRGIFLAFVEMHGQKDADFWGWGEHAPKDGRVIVNRTVTAGADKNAGFVAGNEWTADGSTIVKESLVAALTRSGEGANVLDLRYTLNPASDVTLSRWAFSGFCVRTRKDARLTALDPDGDVKLPNPNHLKPETDWPAKPWYAYELQLNDNTIVGVAVIDHPQNPKSLWHNHRDICMLNPSIVAPAAVMLSAGKPLVLRYRVVAYDGQTQPRQLDRFARDFTEQK
jgi:hypothetical protein